MTNLEKLAFEVAVLSNDDLQALSEILSRDFASRAEALEMAMRVNHIERENLRLKA